VVRYGAVIDPAGPVRIKGGRSLFDFVRDEPVVSATAIQTVGEKDYDGSLMTIVLQAWRPAGSKR
jgi:hypothetical protein